MKKPLLIFTLLAISIFAICAAAPKEQPSEDDLYLAALEESGFPEDYAVLLLELHHQHPNWTFEPLDITGLSNGKYTWDYVIYMETDNNAKTSLVSASAQYKVLRHKTDTNLYDTGWYRASKEAVEFMMDPRNFISSDTQIFQFYDLGWSENVSLAAVQSVLVGTFMENARLDDIYSDLTYAEYFMKVGQEVGANPVYLAARVRNEQGVNGSSSLISGLCGDKLWYYYSNKMTGTYDGSLIQAPTSGWTESSLKAYNGYYNYFNIGAGGTGTFNVLLNGMKEARESGWDTRWKAILGGAATASGKYIKDYQNTSYLQKFNVDPRSKRNFWGQYMQSIHGSYGQAASIASSLRKNGLMDIPYNFVIPVYQGMPESCPYPAN